MEIDDREIVELVLFGVVNEACRAIDCQPAVSGKLLVSQLISRGYSRIRGVARSLMRWLAVTVVLGGGSLASAGCSSGEGSAGASGSPTERFFQEYGEIVCSNAASCCTAQNGSFDAAECRLFFTEFVTLFAGEATVYDEAIAEQCFAKLAPAYQSCPFGPQPAECTQVLSGEKPLGAECDGLFECAKPMICDILESRCKTLILVEPGGACGPSQSSDEVRSCSGATSYCDPATSTCKVYGAVGDDCTDGECLDELRCDAATQLCAARIDSGGACQGEGCVDRHYCSDAGVCEPLKQDGEPCTSFFECLGLCDQATQTCAEGSSGDGSCGDIEFSFGG
jgi:hypothetical protein